MIIINKVKENIIAEFYADEAVTKGWSRDFLLNAIKMDTYSVAQEQIKSNNFSLVFSEVNATLQFISF